MLIMSTTSYSVEVVQNSVVAYWAIRVQRAEGGPPYSAASAVAERPIHFTIMAATIAWAKKIIQAIIIIIIIIGGFIIADIITVIIVIVAVGLAGRASGPAGKAGRIFDL